MVFRVYCVFRFFGIIGIEFSLVSFFRCFFGLRFLVEVSVVCFIECKVLLIVSRFMYKKNFVS